jgi:hypothetical protein
MLTAPEAKGEAVIIIPEATAKVKAISIDEPSGTESGKPRRRSTAGMNTLCYAA